MATRLNAAAMIAAAAGACGAVMHWLAAIPFLTVFATAAGAGVTALLAGRSEDGDIAAKSRGSESAIVKSKRSPAHGADQSVLNALPLGLMIVAADRRIRFTNRSFDQMLARSGVAGMDISILRANRLTERVEMAIRREAGSTLEFNLTRAGDALLKAHIKPLPGGDALVTVEDQTQSKRAEEMHRDFVANASHELKTPLAASSGIIETLLGHAKTDPEASERFLALLQVQVRRMTRLIEDLMSLNRIEMNARVLPEDPINLADVLAETVDILRPVAEQARIDLALQTEGTQFQVTGDRDQLAQVFANLVDNAIKHSGKGKTVRIHAAAQRVDPGMVGVVVQDEGIGIEHEHLPRLTERFYRVNVRQSRETGGTGLGLAIVKHILNRHRGRLSVESEPGAGTSFTVWLPTRREEPSADKDAPDTKVSQN